MNFEALARLHAALTREEAWQRAEHEAIRRRPVADRVAHGLTWAPCAVEDTSDAGRGRTLLRLRAPRGGVFHDGIGAGEPVLIAPIGAPDDGVTGLSLGAEGDVAEVIADGEPPAGVLAITRRFDATTFERYRAALIRADRADSPLRDVLLGVRAPAPPADVAIDDPHLGASQRAAVAAALGADRVALVHGPPGTGKTEVIVAMLRRWVAAGDRPWALADSNAAADHLAARAARAGLQVVRVGHPARVGGDAARLTLDARIARGPLAAALAPIDRDLSRLRGDDSRDGRAKRRELYAARDVIARQARDAALTSAQVIVCTLGTLAKEAPDLPRAIHAVVDEATQAIEPAIWTVVPWVERLVLVGDPRQLGPVVLEPDNPLARSLLDRLLDPDDPAGGRLPMPMLTVQHRMHADIQALVDPVYGGALTPHPSVAGHRLADRPGVAATPLTSRAVLWVDTAGAGHDEAVDPTTRSLFNPGEVALARDAVARLREAGVAAADIGVIAPYAAQVARLRAEPALAGVEVATVNAFQGREKEVIVASFVRSNPDGTLGFVADERRLTVALTRARRLLVAVGDGATLSRSPAFARVLDAAAALGALVSAFEEPFGEGVGLP